jgi:hypothetical protein
MRARDLTKGNIAYHDTLNQDVWSGSELRVDVRYKLLEIAKRFIEYLEVPNFKLEDVILRGSLVNYNYTQYSDFDLHIVTDFSTLDCDITEAFYLAKKKIWNDEHDITIKGHEVELYVEDKDAKNVSEGTYSVLDAKWLRTPEYRQPDINDRAVSAKARDLMTQINRAVKQGSIEDITRLQDKIRLMRQAGLDTSGEFSTENLAYKIIRNKKFLDKLYKTKNQRFDQELSLDESEETYSVKTEEGQEFKCNDLDHAKNKARKILSYKTADKVYILKNGKAIYSWQLNSSLKPLDESVSQNAVMAALVAALSGSPAQANYCNPETTQSHPNQTQNAITIMRGITNVQNFERAGMHIEAVGEAAKLFKNISKMPNKDCVAPIVKDQLPPLTDPGVNERKKAKKKKKSSKRRRPAGGYYGYYWGGYNDSSDSGGGDAGGGGDGGGGESMYESAARLDPEVEDFLEGLTPDDVGYDEVGDYIVHYEGFTDQCQDSEEYQDDPEAVFNDVWGDFKRRMGDKDPINYGIVGEHDYPIVYSVFRR